MKYKKIAYFTPITFQDVGGIVKYFVDNSEEFFLYLYPPSYRNQPSIIKHYKSGSLMTTENVWLYKGNNKVIIHFFYYFYYIYFLIKYRINRTIILFYFPIFLFLNSIINVLTSNKYVFWIWDYFPSNSQIMIIYNLIVKHYNNKLKYVIYLSPALNKLYSKKENYNTNNHRDTITLGIENIKIERSPKKNLIGYIGNLRGGQGLEQFLKFIKCDKHLNFQLIGDGPIKIQLEEYVKKNKIKNRVQFLGFLKNEKITDAISKWQVAIAPYALDVNSSVPYADPGKLKLYIQYEIPIIVTKINNYFYEDLLKNSGGVGIELEFFSFVNALKTIQKNYPRYSKGTVKLKTKYYYKRYYDKKFQFLLKHE